MKVQVVSLASRIDVNQEEMKATLDASLEMMEANPREQTHELEVVKRAVGISVRIRKMNIRTLWRSQTPPKRKKILLAA
jgi:hypothetical protein